MMPPVSLPLNGGTSSARAGAQASIPHMATRLAAPIIRIADSILLGRTLARVPQKWIALSRSEHHLVLVRIRRRGKKGRPVDGDLAGRCCRVALDLLRASRHRRRVGSSGGLPMRDLFTTLKRLSLGAAVGLGLLAFGQPAEAAN